MYEHVCLQYLSKVLTHLLVYYYVLVLSYYEITKMEIQYCLKDWHQLVVVFKEINTFIQEGLNGSKMTLSDSKDSYSVT